MFNQVFSFIPFIFIIVFCFILFSFLYTKGKQYKNISKLPKDNNYVLKNQDKLNQKFSDSYKELEPLKKRIIYLLIIVIICIVASFLIKNKYFSYFSIGLSIVLLAISSYSYSSKSDKKFTEIAKEIIHDYDNDLEYKPHEGFSYSEYALCRFPEDCDRFYSEDMIINEKKGFYFADIKVESEHRDKDDDTYYVTEYEGSLARIYIEDVNCKIYLGGMQIGLFFRNDDYKKIKLENDEFNKLFMAYTDNELLAYKLLTPDVMEEFVKIKKNSFGDIDIRILNNKLYIRFLSGNGFDSSSFKQEIDKDNLCSSIAVLEEVMKTMEKVKTIINDKNIE